MQRFWSILYGALVIPFLWLLIRIAALFKRKVRRGIRGRRNLFEDLKFQTSSLLSAEKSRSSAKRVWFHSSSLGEFEQAKPIIAELKRRRPDLCIIVSFFSPSGFDHSRNFRLADVITYIPFDSRRGARKFIELLRPDAAVMVRYDVWPNHIWALKEIGVPTFIANATMNPSSLRCFPFSRSFHRAVYNEIDYILTVSEQDVQAFRKFHLTNPVLAAIGDTRYDQVWQRSEESKLRHILPQELIEKRKILVAGSSWDSDEEVLIPAIAKLTREDPKFLTILVPHEPILENLERIDRELNGKLSSIRFSDLHDYSAQNVIIIDSVGILMALYQYAIIAYVGGGFSQGVHNVLEPAVYGKPVLFGPQYRYSQEAGELVREGAAFVATNEDELYRHLHMLLSDSSLRTQTGLRAKAFVERNTGATRRFLSYLEKVL